MQTNDRTEPAAGATLAQLSRRRTRLLRDMQEARSGPTHASLLRLGAELIDVERQMTVLIGSDRLGGPFEPRLQLPDSAQG